MVERVKSEKNSRERILIKNSLVIKGSVDSNTEISVFLCIILRVCVDNPKLVEGLPQKHRGTDRHDDYHSHSQFLATMKVAILGRY